MLHVLLTLLAPLLIELLHVSASSSAQFVVLLPGFGLTLGKHLLVFPLVNAEGRVLIIWESYRPARH